MITNAEAAKLIISGIFALAIGYDCLTNWIEDHREAKAKEETLS